ncbi:hypothetical protein [Mesorhizobium sp.]|uniref:DUF6904 family protein n=1 Tax=Mesorhizobium sp. TaxID=1871066 RepID=UPI0025DD00B6|nr:hypothetical protein [Mesorhizobium sp.]
MLSYQLLKNHAGILLIGDYTSLRWLHTVVHDINERSPLIKDREGLFLSLAYDVRKAYERQREILQPPPDHEEMGIRYGVQALWPVILLQQRMLRVSLAYLEHTAKTQAIAYALEAVIEEALEEDFAALALKQLRIGSGWIQHTAMFSMASGAVPRFSAHGQKLSEGGIFWTYCPVSNPCTKPSTHTAFNAARRIFCHLETFWSGITSNGLIRAGRPNQARDKRPGFDYMSRMIHLTATYWYFRSSLAAGGLRSI